MRKRPFKRKPYKVLQDLIKLINPIGHLVVIGVDISNDPGAADEHSKNGEYMIPFGKIWEKGMSVGTG